MAQDLRNGHPGVLRGKRRYSPDGGTFYANRPLNVELQAETLLALGRPALLPLVGQTHLVTPATVLPMVVSHLRSVAGVERRGRVLMALLALLPDEEIVAMVERLFAPSRREGQWGLLGGVRPGGEQKEYRHGVEEVRYSALAACRGDRIRADERQ